MNFTISTLIDMGARAGAILLVANEIRGLILAAPVFYGLYAAGGTAMALWLAFCSLSGIALSVVVPLFMARRVQQLLHRRKARPA
jgi:heme exporter protein D